MRAQLDRAARNAVRYLVPFALLGESHSAFAEPVPEVDRLYETIARGSGPSPTAGSAASFFADALLARLDPGDPPTIVAGGEQAARALLGDSPRDVRFRITGRHPGPGRIVDVGILRLRSGGPLAASERYMRFSFTFETADGDWRIRSATSAPASLHDFEDAPGDLLPAAGERLSYAYYGNLVGTYRREDGCRYDVTRSTARLLLLDTCSRAFHALQRMSGRTYQGGRYVSALPPFEFTVSFPGPSREPAATMVVSGLGAPPVTATREPSFSSRDVQFASRDGARLAGTLLIPSTRGPHPGVVLVHGSGPQDRHGEASILDVIARQFVHAGFAVLQYDKRGVGGSTGDWRTAGFATLAEDVAAGRAALMSSPDVIHNAVGIAGSSQAGWISAKAVMANPDIPFVLLLGAAGTALNVQDQNAYNSRVTMGCSGVPRRLTEAVVAQQRLYYRAERDPSLRDELASATAVLAGDARLEPFLMPATVDRSDMTAWFVVMETDFDPRPIWRRYTGTALFAYGDFDDQTPAAVAARRVADLGNRNIRVVRAAVAQHSGFVAADVCHVGYDSVSRFDPGFWQPIEAWIGALGTSLRRRVPAR